MQSTRLILTVCGLLMTALTASCGTTSLRTSQIHPRAEALECIALPAIRPDQWHPPAADPDFSALLPSITPADRAAIESAAGRYARQVQIQEQGFTAQRDIQQTGVNREMCNRQHELGGLIEANNAGPSH